MGSLLNTSFRESDMGSLLNTSFRCNDRILASGFGRIADQNWTGGTTDVDRFQYGYDRNGNRLYEENLLDSSKSELYGPYDNLNRLTTFARDKKGVILTFDRYRHFD